MKFDEVKPVIYISRCLGFDKCRWNGDMVNDGFVNLLKQYMEFRDVCPEAEIGLGIPRNPVRLVKSKDDNRIRMLQPATGDDCTDRMAAYCQELIEGIERVDGFLLKSASPSCGITNIKVYTSIAKGASSTRASGMLAAAARERFPMLPFEDEGRLHNFVLRENWLMAAYSIARLRNLRDIGEIKSLYDFQARHKYLFMSYSQSRLREMGHLLANHDKKDYREIYAAYEAKMISLLSAAPSIPRRINVLMHMMGYFSNELNQEEKQYFLNLLEEYRRGAMPLTVPMEIIRSWAIRFNNDYILSQVILQPYPKELLILSDSGKGRDLRR